MTEITRADREVFKSIFGLTDETLDLAGDDARALNLIARHREQAERETVARIVAWLRDEAAQTRPFDYEIADIWESGADAIAAENWNRRSRNMDEIIGRKVAKRDGDYRFDGTIVGVVTKLSGEVRYVVEDDRGLLLIMNARQVGLK